MVLDIADYNNPELLDNEVKAAINCPAAISFMTLLHLEMCKILCIKKKVQVCPNIWQTVYIKRQCIHSYLLFGARAKSSQICLPWPSL